jgi:uncharacterized protein (TIGR00730 family)
MTKIISIFGGSAPSPGSPAYEEARQLGRLLVEAGFSVATGGYDGTMAAVSQGAHEAGGHVVGVITDLFMRRGLQPNTWVRVVVNFPTLRERLMHLVTSSDGLVALKGGVGTLSEVALAWSFLQTAEMDDKPFVLVGPSWRRVIELYAQESYVNPDDLALLTLAETPEEAVEALHRRLLSS